MTFKRLTRAALLLCAGLSTTAFAHNPMCECKEIPGEQIQCKGGFSDGSRADNYNYFFHFSTYNSFVLLKCS